MGSLRWIRNLIVDGEPTTIEIMLGTENISDKCYVRINSEQELWFKINSDFRDDIVSKGLDILRERFKDNVVKLPNGQLYNWT